MGSYIVRRILQMIPVVILVTIFVFLMLHLSGDPITLLSGGGEALDQQQIAAIRAQYNLTAPFLCNTSSGWARSSVATWGLPLSRNSRSPTN